MRNSTLMRGQALALAVLAVASDSVNLPMPDGFTVPSKRRKPPVTPVTTRNTPEIKAWNKEVERKKRAKHKVKIDKRLSERYIDPSAKLKAQVFVK